MAGNNCCGFSFNCGAPIPNVLEITWMNIEFAIG
jgi:hypothetical protein